MIKLKKVQDADLQNKTVLLRADLDIPIEKGEISDETRLKSSFDSINYLVSKAKKVILMGHLGRPGGKDEKLSLKIVAHWYKSKLKGSLNSSQYGDFEGWDILPNLSLLENLRFDPEEEKNDPEFAKKLSNLAQIYVNDAFASSHRAHASIVGVTKYLPSFAGLRLQKEVEELSKVLENPKRPFTIIIGGAKIETKLPLVEKMHHFADYVLVGGEIAENDKVLAKVAHEKLTNKISVLLVADLTNDKKDITEHSTQNFVQIINLSKTIVWNGPMGMFEQCFDLGTRGIAEAVANSKAHTVVGGGDTISFLEKEGLISQFSFVSMGGGAMLEFLAGEKLPGIEALENRN